MLITRYQPLLIILALPLVSHAVANEQENRPGQHFNSNKTPGLHSESHPDIEIPESVLRTRDILDEMQVGDLSERPELPGLEMIPYRPERVLIPERPVLPERPVIPGRPNRPDLPGRPNKPGRP